MIYHLPSSIIEWSLCEIVKWSLKKLLSRTYFYIEFWKGSRWVRTVIYNTWSLLICSCSRTRSTSGYSQYKALSLYLIFVLGRHVPMPAWACRSEIKWNVWWAERSEGTASSLSNLFGDYWSLFRKKILTFAERVNSFKD